jgi:hypothetical protein
MIVLEESPWYQEIISRGMHRDRVEMLVHMLQQRFGTVPPDVPVQLATLDLQTLYDLVGPAVMLPSLEAFQQILAQHSTPESSDNAE